MRQAIETNDLPGLLRAINVTPDINQRWFYVQALDSTLTALQLAAYLGHRDMVACLLDHGAQPNVQSAEKESCLQSAARFLSFGFWQREGRYTALHLAARYAKSPDCISLLLAAGAEYHLRDRRGQLPLTLHQLCYKFSTDDRLTSFDLSIYGNFKAEYLPLLETAFIRGQVKKIKVKLPDISFGSDHEALNLFFELIERLKRNRHLSEIILDVAYLFKTNEYYNGYKGLVLGSSTDGSLIQIRREVVQVLQAILSLAEQTQLESFDFGVMKHVHKKTAVERKTVLSSRMRYNALRNSHDIEYFNEITESETITTEEKELLTLNDRNAHDIASVTPEQAIEHLRELDDAVMQKGVGWIRSFYSEETKLANKIIDADVIVGFCHQITQRLRQSATTAPSVQVLN